ncbi:MAG: Flp1 family type IVb pilin [Mobilitalea sp.]
MQGFKCRFQKAVNKQVDAMGIIELILILVIIIGLVVIFNKEISAIISTAVTAFTGDANSILK